jgi:hypothetical protein
LAAALAAASPAWAGRHGGTCTVSGRKVPAMVVTVEAKEASPFKLRVEGLAVEVATGGLEQPAVATVHAPLDFHATIAADAIPARTRRPVDALSGLVHLAAATEKLTLHAALRSSQVDVDVRLGGVELRGLVLPCDALTLDDVAEPNVQPVDGSDGERFAAAGKVVHLRSGPGSGGAIELVVDDGDALDLVRTETQGEWMRVTSRWADGTTLTGWARTAELVPARGHGLVNDLPLPAATTACAAEPTTRVGERIVAAAVAPGTLIYAARYLGPWAKIVDGKKLKVRVRAKDDWAEIVEAPGVASVNECATATALLDAWVPRAAVQLPAEHE